MDVITKMQDLTYLEWTKTRHSSGTAGSFLKAQENIRGNKYYYKLSNYDVVQGIIGHECVNEILVDRLLTELNIPHLSYQLLKAKILIKGKELETYLCRSRDFKVKGDSKIALDVFYDMEALEDESPLDFCLRMGFGNYIWQMLLVDYLILNRDRHGANIEILKNRYTKAIYPAPLFDHGVSLLFQCKSTNEIMKADPLEDKKIQCFVGSNSSFDNLRLIPAEHRIALPVFDTELKERLFFRLDDVMGDIWVEYVWKFLKMRAEAYEDFCNKKS